MTGHPIDLGITAEGICPLSQWYLGSMQVEHTHKPQRGRGYLPTLDGWRALAVLGVMLGHDVPHRIGPFSTSLVDFHDLYGGVDVFFAISGILICSRLLEEEQVFGKISLRNFYLRRGFRILPAAFAYLAVLALLAAVGWITVYPGEWIGSVFFCRNYSSLLHLNGKTPIPYFTAHFWSLSVEEHFYLLLPAILVFFRGRPRLWVLAALGCLVVLNREVQLTVRAYDHISFHTDVRLDALIFPALLAVIVRTTSAREPIYRCLKWWPLVAIVLFAVMTIPIRVSLQTVAVSLMMPCVILGSVFHSKGLTGRFLEWGPLRYMGRISYSLYLWQMLFFTSKIYGAEPLGYFERWPLNFICTFLVASLSYHFLEMPMIRLGHRVAPSATPGRSDLHSSPSPA